MSRKLVCLLVVGWVLALAGAAGAAETPGKVLFEYWFDIGGTNVNADLRSVAAFPGTPSVSSGMNEEVEAALLAASGAATPAMAPLPKSSGR